MTTHIQSLAGNAVTLDEASSRVRAVAVHPGVARTNLAETASGSSAAFDRYLGWFFNDVERGALPIEYP